MEGMPRFAPIVPELKKPVNQYDEEFVYSLKEYILMHFQVDPSDFDQPISELQCMKDEVLKCNIDEQATCVLKRYYAQLLMMKNRFPMTKGGEVRVSYSWHEKALEMPTAQTYYDIHFEMACVMYQIGAIHANIAGMENRQSDDSIKKAFMHFQYAAWPLQQVRDNPELFFSRDESDNPISDFDKDLLTFYVNVLLAQAQECLLEKSMLESKRSPLLVAKLATYLRDLYSKCLSLLRNSNQIADNLSSKKYKSYNKIVAVKSEVYGAIAMLYLGYNAEKEQKFGTRLGFCQAADHYLKRAIQAAGGETEGVFSDTLTFVNDVVKARLENALKENNFVYHERVPKLEDLLQEVEGQEKVKPLAFKPLDPSVSGDDIFGALVPPTVLSAVSEYEEEKAKLKRDVLERVAAKDTELNEYLSLLNAAELGLSGGPSYVLPDMLLERNAAMHSQVDAVPRVLEKLQLVDQLSRDADSQLNAMFDRLKSIDLPEFTSDEGYKTITAEIKRLLEHHVQARTLNGELHKALAAHSTNMNLLSLPLRELTEKIAPQCDVAPAQTKEGEALIRVLDKVNEMQTQRAMLIGTFNKELNNDVINNQLLTDKFKDYKVTFLEELKKHEQTIKYIDANLAAQETIMHYLTEANADFDVQRKAIQEVNKNRFDQVMTLLTAHDIYLDINRKADDGKKFYDAVFQRIIMLKKTIEAIESAYLQEREKIDAERRAIEEKKAAIRAARETEEALADFGSLSIPNSSPAMAPKTGGRGSSQTNYMEFYRNKMAAKGGVQNYSPLPSPLSPVNNLMPESRMNMSLSSPAPSSIGNDFHEDSHYQPGYQNVQHFQPPPASYQVPRGFPGDQSLNYQRQDILPSSSHCQPPLPPASPQNFSSSAYQPQPPTYSYNQQAYSGQSTHHGHIQAPQIRSYSPALSTHSMHSISPSPQSVFPQKGVPPQQGIPSVFLGQQMHSLPPVNNNQPSQFQSQHRSAFEPVPSPHSVQLPQGQQFYENPNYSMPSCTPSLQHGIPPQQLPPPSSMPQGSLASQVPPVHQMPPSMQTIPPVSSHSIPQGPPAVQQQPPPLHQIPSIPPMQSIPPPPSSQLPPVSLLQGPPLPSQQTTAPHQIQQNTSTPLTQNSNRPLPTSSWGTPNQPITSFGSPWHNTARSSPWHQNLPNSMAPVQQQTVTSGFVTPALPSNETLPPNNMGQPAVQTGSNVDLLSSLLGDIHLPPALTPMQTISQNMPTETQKYQQAAPITPTCPAPTAVSVQNEVIPIIRPAAAVMPMQQKTMSYNSQGIKSTVVSEVPSQSSTSSSIVDLINPEKFSIGESDKMRLEKRSLHAAIKSNVPLPGLDPLDPLNQLDAFWTVKKE